MVSVSWWMLLNVNVLHNVHYIYYTVLHIHTCSYLQTSWPLLFPQQHTTHPTNFILFSRNPHHSHFEVQTISGLHFHTQTPFLGSTLLNASMYGQGCLDLIACVVPLGFLKELRCWLDLLSISDPAALNARRRRTMRRAHNFHGHFGTLKPKTRVVTFGRCHQNDIYLK